MNSTATKISAVAIAVFVGILLIDCAVATYRGPRDDRLIKDLQQQTKADAKAAPQLAAVQKQVTSMRQSRKTRDNFLAWALIVAGAIFVVSSGKLLGRNPVALLKSAGKDSCPTVARASLPAALDLPTIDLTFVDEAVARLGRGRESAIPLLQAIQTHYRYLPDEALRRMCELTEITPAEVAGTSTFYAHFRRSPLGDHLVRVCHGTACHVSGARQITEELRRYLAIPEGADTDSARRFTLDEVACLGCCSLAPVVMVDDQTAGKLTPATACEVLEQFQQQKEAA